ncbi:MAG TPA: DUF4349 domain-containing protein [Flavobacterium sp.]|nr:DUF4349 domain-containing protein [Flavobacterium sp.]
MKTITKLGLASLLVIALLFSCKRNEAPAEKAPVTEESAPGQEKDIISSSAAVANTDNRKFIRTASIKFKVKNAAKSTYAIENATTKFGGFVAYTNLQSNISKRESTKVSQDSTLETTRYTVENNITIRVPNTQLDTVVKTIAKQIDFLNSRVIKADDVSIQMLANEMAQGRSALHEKRLEKAIDMKGKKLSTIVDAENTLDAKKEQNDQKKLDNLSLNDQVKFSTLTLEIYQNETVKQEMIANEKNIDAYRSHIGVRILDGLKTGWFMLEAIIGFVVQLWSLVLIGAVGFFVFCRFVKK